MTKKAFRNKYPLKGGKGSKNKYHNSKGSKRPENRKLPASSDEEAVVDKDTASKMYNDPNWYFTDSVIADQASQLAFQQFLGTSDSKIQDYNISTVMTIHLNPSPGPTYPSAASIDVSKKSGFNMAMIKLFNKLSMKSGRNMAYAPQDVGMSILAEGELLSMISYVKRTFGLAQTYNMRNRQFPKEIINMLGIDADDFFKNFSNYRMRFNTLLASVNQIPILTNSGYLRKCLTLYDNIFTDGENSMAQTYAYVPDTTWIIDESSQQTGTYLRTVNVCHIANRNSTAPVPMKFSDFMNNILEPMVSALLESSTLNLVYADLMNLAGIENWSFFKFEPISDSYTVMPVYDLMTLKQIHNTTLITGAVGPNSEFSTNLNDVYSDPSVNGIKYAPAFNYDILTGPDDEYNGNGYPVVIDTDNSAPDMKERIEITRYKCALGFHRITVNNVKYTTLTTVPDHWASFAVMYKVNSTAAQAILLYSYLLPEQVTPDRVAALEKFDWHPLVFHVTNPASGYSRIQNVLGDMGFFTYVDYLYLRRLNQIVYMGLFEIRNDLK